MASGLGKRIIGGALMGAGTGLVERAEAKRAMALKLIEEQYRAAENRADRQFRAGESQKQREFQGGLVRSTQRAEDGTMYGITGTGERVDLGFKGAESASLLREKRLMEKMRGGEGGDDDMGWSADEARAWDRAVQRHTDKSSGYEVTDWQKVEKTLREKHPRLADFAVRQESEGLDVDDPLWDEAGDYADAKTAERKSVLKPRAWEFPETEGSAEDFRKTARDQRYQELKGMGRQGLMPGGANTQPDTAPAETASKYPSPEAVKAAYEAGELTREEALSILQQEFGMQ